MKRLLRSSRRPLLAAVAALVVGLAAVSAGCCPCPNASWYVESPPTGPVEPLTDGGPDTYANFAHAMSYPDRVAFSRAVASLRLGDPMSRVVQVLGEPDDAGYTAAYLPVVHCRFYLSYDIAPTEEDPTGSKGAPWVDLYFNSYGRLEYVASEYPGVASRKAVCADRIAYCLCPGPPLPPHRDRTKRFAPPPTTGPASAPSTAAADAGP